MAEPAEPPKFLPVRSAVPIKTIRGYDEQDTRLLHKMAEEARL